MKISEFSQSTQIDEGLGSALIGDRAASAIRGFFSGKGTKHTMYQQAFLKDFYQDAITSLDNGVRGGFVDPNIVFDLSTGSGGEDNPTGDTVVDPSSVKPGAAAATATKSQQQTNQTLNNYIKQAAQTINSTTDKNQKIALTKELVNAMADRKGYPEWENALATVQQVIKKGNVDPNFATAAISNLKAGKTMAEAYKIYYMNMLVESVGLTWNDLGLCIIKQNNGLYLAEQKYVKMDKLFESIMEATDSQALSIEQYMLDWFKAYMKGTNWESYKNQVLPQIELIGDTYKSDRGKAAIKKLAKTALAISKASPSKPAGAPDVPKGAEEEKPTEDPISAAIKNLAGGNEVEQQLAAIQKNNPEAFKKAIAKLGAS